ncbi:hypothetical protein MRS76_21065 [Rhizobiaceae bacterium n13]|uniref:Uncharacterized protein n=1 Tax=Ferirhizobium litorale TaxID=2927786 RepID=A0AAE3QIU4_9HYPH|nr:hypothetical protein [Fererhizobium litorale]MDI7864433.1 hypothetical protein [Fererhizobium litorale]MDI7924653.1 hypothetical protein [Fererhizobium litorale]
MKIMRPILLVALMVAADAFAAPWCFASPPDRRCTCRNRDGEKYQLGETVCIRIGDVSYLARCEMELNVTTWRKLDDGCPEARLQGSLALGNN